MKIQDKILAGFSALALAASLFGCTDKLQLGDAFLETAQSGALPLDSVFSNATYTEQYLADIYAMQYYGLPHSYSPIPHSANVYTVKLDALTDLYQHHWDGVDAYTLFYGGKLTSRDNPPISYTDDCVWEAIRRGWTLINNVSRVPDLEPEEKASMVAQAECLIAARYFDLYSVYGGLPWVGRDTTIASRLTAEATADSIVVLLDSAIVSGALPWKYHDGDGVSTDENATSNRGRWTKAGAMALKAKVLLFNASPIYNSNEPYYGGSSEAEQKHLVWHGDYSDERWKRALRACEDFFDANGETREAARIAGNKAADVHSTVNDATYHLNGNKGSAWEIVASGSKKTSDAAKIDYYRQSYRMGYVYQNSAEVIHSTHAVANTSEGTWWSWANPFGGVNRNCYCPTEEYAEMFAWSNGQPFDWQTDSVAGKIAHIIDAKGKETVGQLFYKFTAVRGGWNKVGARDPRLYENAFVCSQPRGHSWITGASFGDIIELWTGGYDAGNDVMKIDADGEPVVSERLMTACPTGYGTIKYVLGSEYEGKPAQWVYLSYNEMLLMYAECLLQTGEIDNALKVCDRIRARTGLGTFSSQKANYTKIGIDLNNKDHVLEQILCERACELGMSNNRYYDMVRYKRTDWMTKRLRGLGTFRTKQNSGGEWVRDYSPYVGSDKDSGLAEPNRFEYTRFELRNRSRVLWGEDPGSPEVSKWLLFPFPDSEVAKGYGLIQNPGW